MNALDDLKFQRMDRPIPTEGAGRAIRAGRRRRHRRVALVAAVVVAVGAGAGLGVNAVAGGGQRGFRVTPAGPPAPSLATVNGVDVTWLPAGYRPDNSLLQGNVPTLAQVGWYQEFHNPGLAKPNQRFAPQFSTVGLALLVDRGASVDLTAIKNDLLLKVNEFKPSWMTVRGQRALLMSRAHTKLWGAPAFKLFWTETPGTVLEVDGYGGPTVQDVEHLAASLVVHPGPTPDADSAAATQIRDAFKLAYTATKTPETALTAVEDGSSVAGTLAKVTKAEPLSVNSSQVTVGDINFLSPTEAFVKVDVTYKWMDSGVSNALPQRAVVSEGRWKVSRESYCSTIGASGISCPPR
jgi:hypothetical protein